MSDTESDRHDDIELQYPEAMPAHRWFLTNQDFDSDDEESYVESSEAEEAAPVQRAHRFAADNDADAKGTSSREAKGAGRSKLNEELQGMIAEAQQKIDITDYNALGDCLDKLKKRVIRYKESELPDRYIAALIVIEDSLSKADTTEYPKKKKDVYKSVRNKLRKQLQEAAFAEEIKVRGITDIEAAASILAAPLDADAPRAERRRRVVADASAAGWATVGTSPAPAAGAAGAGAAVVDPVEQSIRTRLAAILERRGRKGTDRMALLADMYGVLAEAHTLPLAAHVLSQVVALGLDLVTQMTPSPTSNSSMEHWRVVLASVARLVSLLTTMTRKGLAFEEDVDSDDAAGTAKAKAAKAADADASGAAPVRIVGSVLSSVMRLHDYYVLVLQNADGRVADYVYKLVHVAHICEMLERAFVFYSSRRAYGAAARVAGALIFHLHWRRHTDHVALLARQRTLSTSASATATDGSEFPNLAELQQVASAALRQVDVARPDGEGEEAAVEDDDAVVVSSRARARASIDASLKHVDGQWLKTADDTAVSTLPYITFENVTAGPVKRSVVITNNLVGTVRALVRVIREHNTSSQDALDVAHLQLIFTHATHGEVDTARDTMLVARLHDDSSSQRNVHVSVAHHRAIIALGIGYFFAGRLSDAHSMLCDVSNLPRVKELVLASEASRRVDGADRRDRLPYHMQLNGDVFEAVALTVALLVELPGLSGRYLSHATPPSQIGSLIVNPALRRAYAQCQAQTFTGTPEQTREYIVLALRHLLASRWRDAVTTISSIPAWGAVAELTRNGAVAADVVKAHLTAPTKVVALKVFISRSPLSYGCISTAALATRFELPAESVRAVMVSAALDASAAGTADRYGTCSVALDQPTDALRVRAAPPSRLHAVALDAADALADHLCTSNERALDRGRDDRRSALDDARAARHAAASYAAYPTEGRLGFATRPQQSGMGFGGAARRPMAPMGGAAPTRPQARPGQYSRPYGQQQYGQHGGAAYGYQR